MVEYMIKCGKNIETIKFAEKCQQIQREIPGNVGMTGLSKYVRTIAII